MNKRHEPKRISKRVKMFFGFFSGDVKVEMNPRTEPEKQLIRRRIFWAVFLIAIISIATYGIVILLNSIRSIPNSELSYYEKYLTIISFLGVMVTAIVTILTTYFIVHQSKRIDYHKERLSVMPFLEVSLIISPTEFNAYNKPGEHKHLQLFCANKGSGLAIHVFGKDDNPDSTTEKNITVGSCTKLDEYYDVFPSPIALRFMDIFENIYLQKFDVHYTSDLSAAYVTSFPPVLIKRTSRFRYTQ